MQLLIPIVENELRSIETPYGRSLYEIERKTIMEHICEQLTRIKNAEIVFVLHKNDVEKYHLDNVIRLLVPTASIVVTEGKTAGAACSCMLAIDHLKEEAALIIVGGDQLVTTDLQVVVDRFVREDWDGGVLCFDDIHPRWSYVMLDENGLVAEVAEKNPISRNATTGFYYFKRTGDFVESVFSMIKKKAAVNGKYYICPVYNELILKQKKIGVHFIDKSQYFNFSHQKGVEMFEKYLEESVKDAD